MSSAGERACSCLRSKVFIFFPTIMAEVVELAERLANEVKWLCHSNAFHAAEEQAWRTRCAELELEIRNGSNEKAARLLLQGALDGSRAEVAALKKELEAAKASVPTRERDAIEGKRKAQAACAALGRQLAALQKAAAQSVAFMARERKVIVTYVLCSELIDDFIDVADADAPPYAVVSGDKRQFDSFPVTVRTLAADAIRPFALPATAVEQVKPSQR